MQVRYIPNFNIHVLRDERNREPNRRLHTLTELTETENTNNYRQLQTLKIRLKESEN